MRGLTDLHRTRGGATGCTLVKVQAGVFPWEFKGANKLSCVGFKVSRRRFIADIDNASGELMPSNRDSEHDGAPSRIGRRSAGTRPRITA